jgi:tripartite-type tricarboxylate transporter receptor subunit TctC
MASSFEPSFSPPRRGTLALAASALLLGVAPSAALAQATGAPAPAAWPTRPIHILVGFPGGSTPDMAARTIAPPLSAALGRPVIVENRPGASGNVAADLVAKATDDHTLGVVINGNLTTSKLLNDRLPFDPATDFAYISLLTTAPLVLVASASQPGGEGFLAAARQAGDRWNYGSPGNGSVGHLGMELLKARAPGVAAVHVPYPGNPQVAGALLSGEIHMALVPPGIAMPHVKAGRLQAVGVTSGRSVLVPEVPPLAELGVRDFVLEVWTALVAPARLPKAAQERLASEIARIVREPDTRQKLFQQGWQAVGSAPQALATRVREETLAMKKIIAARNIRQE